ncbi:unnamed protein product [Durusdinium trenchii]|uniref:RING-type domain-containing protein n=1 Tax=Durusdinium trenchii TaxID=1381693 RepID=A0ABP0S5G4_9DINO
MLRAQLFVPLVFAAVIAGMFLLSALISYGFHLLGINFQEDPSRRGSTLDRRPLTEKQQKALEEEIQAHLPDVFVSASGGEEMTCPVCLDVIQADEPAKQLQCKHYYHSSCLIAWCTKKIQKECINQTTIQCPICRSPHPLDNIDEQPELAQQLGRSLEIVEEVV